MGRVTTWACAGLLTVIILLAGTVTGVVGAITGTGGAVGAATLPRTDPRV